VLDSPKGRQELADELDYREDTISNTLSDLSRCDLIYKERVVKNTIISLLEHEYDDDLYAGVPESAIRRRIGDATASSGIEWLEQINAIERATDGSFVLTA